MVILLLIVFLAVLAFALLGGGPAGYRRRYVARGTTTIIEREVERDPVIIEREVERPRTIIEREYRD